MSRVFEARHTALLTALIAAAGFGGFAERANAFEPSIHKEITREALDFLRSGVLDDIENEHDWADDDGIVLDGEISHIKWVHADSCNLGEMAQQINGFYENAVVNLVGGSAFDPWSASDDFGRVFHPAQDFYSHSNWVELGFPGVDDPGTPVVEISPDDLVDLSTRFAAPSKLGRWATPTPLNPADPVRGDILLGDLVAATLEDRDGEKALEVKDVNGDGSTDAGDVEFTEIPAQWDLGLLPHPINPAAPGFVPAVDKDGDATFFEVPTDGYPIRVFTSVPDYRLLITGVGDRNNIDNVFGNNCDPYVRDASGTVITPPTVSDCSASGEDFYSCIAYDGSRHALTHGDLEKDNPSSTTRFPKAWALAWLQSRHEWCRFVYQTGLSGADGALLSLWVREGASPHPDGTPCAERSGGPFGVTVSIESVQVLDDKEDPGEDGEINLSLFLYDSPFAFHRSVHSQSGPVDVTDNEMVPAAYLPEDVSLCIDTSDSTFRIALHGWDDDDGDGDDFDDENDDAMIGVSLPHSFSEVPVGSSVPGVSSSEDIRVTYRMTRAADADGDGVDECGEPFYGTNPAVADTDIDGLDDGIEIHGSNPTNPVVADTDEDGLDDGDEDLNANGALEVGETNPNDPDSDNDQLEDGIEVDGANPTDPLDSDSDDDGLGDGTEDANASGSVDPGETDPKNPDSDGDKLGDGLELELGTDPLNPDSDGDGLPDGLDGDWLADAIRAIPSSAIKSPAAGNRNAMLNLVADASSLLAKGKVKPALDKLTTLRARVDGCGASADANDWVRDCAIQAEIRALVDLLLGNLPPV